MTSEGDGPTAERRRRQYRRALVVTDMQQAHVAEAFRGAELLELVGQVINRAREAGVPVLFVQHDGALGSPVEPGTPGWEIPSVLGPRRDEIVVRKRGADAFFGTVLAKELRAVDALTIVLVGYATDYCVDTTARSALSWGFDVELVENAHSTIEDRSEIGDGLTAEAVIRHHNAVLASLEHPGRRVTLVPLARIALP